MFLTQVHLTEQCKLFNNYILHIFIQSFSTSICIIIGSSYMQCWFAFSQMCFISFFRHASPPSLDVHHALLQICIMHFFICASCTSLDVNHALLLMCIIPLSGNFHFPSQHFPSENINTGFLNKIWLNFAKVPGPGEAWIELQIYAQAEGGSGSPCWRTLDVSLGPQSA